MGERRMLPIQAILNRSPPRRRPGTPNSQPSASELSSPASDVNDAFPLSMEEPPPKAKKTRDSSDLSYTRPQGPINYPPYEALDAEAFNEMRPFDVYPFGQIGHYCAHIPYSSDKKDVFEKTGRENFNGYWVPYSCARAVCATFCHPIAGALIPIFGPDFPRDCVKPDSPRYGRMDIDERIINEAKFKVSAYRHGSANNLPRPSSVTSHPRSFQDPYFTAMKERLEQYSARRPHTETSHPFVANNLGVCTSQPPAHMAWRSPERQTFGSSPNASPTWSPINAPRERNPPNVDPLLTAVPHVAEEMPRPLRYGGTRRGDEDSLKRRRAGDESLYKRRKVGNESPGRLEHGIIQDSNESTTPTAEDTYEAVRSKLTVPLSIETAHSPQPREPSGDKINYTCKEREAAFSLMSMQKRLPSLDTETGRAQRAKSV
ncbi:Transcriptional repressor-like protein [Hapsidospora chrysogenum ATCC 11550]|uniref:Transcriptional repressor-like protein n=1 Tax=Hapsidospora chrysogenum (strain ATCC 11550 / CBS 779.69 / DSM 880 / IAM 14645 / JCM 23072 / IMI 49137) TaxID=857340 RepID=A0A086TEF0_HAPC1|nr:Transcriptional repressor-like protein [Hapsidospora chrysogenum ATCC 11550]